MNIKTGLLLAIFLLGLAVEACRPPRCPIRSCHIRMKHRHPSKDGEGTGGFNPDAGFDPRTGESLAASSAGPIYRGVPFWQRNKNPKIAQGYKEGYKYRHRKQKPLTAKELKKIEEKNKHQQEKLERKKQKAAEKGEQVEESQTEETQTEETQTEAVEGSEPQAEETKSGKRQKKKKRKQKEAAPEETAPEEAAPKQEQPKPAEDEEKDGF